MAPVTARPCRTPVSRSPSEALSGSARDGFPRVHAIPATPVTVLLLGLWALSASSPAPASAVAAVNDARRSQCALPGHPADLTETPMLDAAAARLAAGATLHEAIGVLDSSPVYAADARLVGIGVGVAGDADIRRALARGYCGLLDHPGLGQIGLARRGATLWVVVAAPFTAPAGADAGRVAETALDLVNAARARIRRCGVVSYGPAPPVALANGLSEVATAHSRSMAGTDALEHEEAGSRTAAERVRRAGLPARHVGENIASGVPTAAEAVAGWLASPGHCTIIMDPRFTAMGLGYAIAPRSPGIIYWTQIFTEPPTAQAAQVLR